KLLLAQACAEHGLDPRTVHELLDGAVASTSEERDWSRACVDELIDHIVERHHGYLRGELPRALVLAHKVARVHGARDSRLGAAEVLLTRIADELRHHIAHEEGEVFPVLRAASAHRPETVDDALDLAADVGAL